LVPVADSQTAGQNWLPKYERIPKISGEFGRKRQITGKHEYGQPDDEGGEAWG
jgi:hypothetical protein